MTNSETPLPQPFEKVAMGARCELQISFIPEVTMDGQGRPVEMNPGRGFLRVLLTAGEEQKVFQTEEVFDFTDKNIFRLFHAEANKGIDTLIKQCLGEGEARPNGMIPVELPGPKIWTPQN